MLDRTKVTNLKQKLATSEATREATKADLKRKYDTSQANRLVQCKKLKADISVLQLKGTSALNAASTSSKIVDEATKDVIRDKSDYPKIAAVGRGAAGCYLLKLRAFGYLLRHVNCLCL